MPPNPPALRAGSLGGAGLLQHQPPRTTASFPPRTTASFPRRRESMAAKDWIPAFAGMTAQWGGTTVQWWRDDSAAVEMSSVFVGAGLCPANGAAGAQD